MTAVGIAEKELQELARLERQKKTGEKAPAPEAAPEKKKKRVEEDRELFHSVD